MPGTIAKGREAIKEAVKKSKEGGTFKPFIRSIYWKDDREEHYVLFLTEIDEIPQFDMIQFIPDGENEKIFHETVAKTDQFFDEKKDVLVDQWDAKIRKTNVAIAIELNPVLEVVKGRKKPVGFEVATEEYERRVVGDDGELTDDTEEVTAPVIGYVAQSPNNFFNHVENYDANDAPINETPVKITRLGRDKHTSYDLQGYDDQPVDLTNLLEYLDGVGYLKDELDAIEDEIENLSDEEAAAVVAKVMLDKRVEELLDDDRYQELLEGVTAKGETLAYGGGKKKGKRESRKGKVARSTRSSQRRTSRDEEPEPNEETEPETEDAESEVEAKPRTRKKRTSSSEANASGGNSKMEELRKRAERKQAERRAA